MLLFAELYVLTTIVVLNLAQAGDFYCDLGESYCTAGCKEKYSNEYQGKCISDGTCVCYRPDGFCFPAVSTVMLNDGSTITMDNLQAGQTVMTVSANGVLVSTKVLALLQKQEDKKARFLRLTTESGHQLQLTATHMLYAMTGNNTNSAEMRMAGDVEVGDSVFVSQHGGLEPSVVVNIADTQLTGVYNPLTEHGTLLVDGVLASCYASFDHDLAHAAMTPLRWFPQLFDVLPMTEDGQHSYAKFMKWLGRTVLPRSWIRKTSKGFQKSYVGVDGIVVIRAAGFVDNSLN